MFRPALFCKVEDGRYISKVYRYKGNRQETSGENILIQRIHQFLRSDGKQKIDDGVLVDSIRQPVNEVTTQVLIQFAPMAKRNQFRHMFQVQKRVRRFQDSTCRSTGL
jgi:hypothetical protein